MSVSSPTTSGEQTLYAARELNKNSWLLAIQLLDRDNPSLHPIKGGDAEGLITKLDAPRQRLAKTSGQVPKLTLCYEAGYDGIWLARFLKLRGVDCRVMDPASLQVDLRGFGARRRGRPMDGSVPVDRRQIDLGQRAGRQRLLVLFDTLSRPSMLRRLREMQLENFHPR